jgi:hypothetical protein
MEVKRNCSLLLYIVFITFVTIITMTNTDITHYYTIIRDDIMLSSMEQALYDEDYTYQKYETTTATAAAAVVNSSSRPDSGTVEQTDDRKVISNDKDDVFITQQKTTDNEEVITHAEIDTFKSTNNHVKLLDTTLPHVGMQYKLNHKQRNRNSCGESNRDSYTGPSVPMHILRLFDRSNNNTTVLLDSDNNYDKHSINDILITNKSTTARIFGSSLKFR